MATGSDSESDARQPVMDKAPEQSGVPEVSQRLWTIPNVLSAIRLAGCFGLVGLALAERPMAVLVLFVILEMTDWFDGRLAIALNQRTEFGAKLDSAADATLAGSTLFAGLWLHWAMLQPELPFMVAAIGTYAVSSLYGLWKFHQIPTYHTYGAKKSWGLITIGVVCIFGGWATWPFRVALIVVTLTNLEAILITRTLTAPHVDVLSIFHARRLERSGESGAS
jgi:cardiolipin synthase